MTPLRKKMTEDLQLRNLSPGTADQYIRHIATFARFFGRSPDLLGTQEIRAFLLHLAERGLAPATRIVYHAALCFFYTVTLGRPQVMATIPRPQHKKSPPRLPLTTDQTHRLTRAALATPFTHAVFVLLLDSGLRVAELAALQVHDIDSDAGLIHVRRGKGHKPRWVRLSPPLLTHLRHYWYVERPRQPWLFPAQRMISPGVIDRQNRWADHPVSTDTIRHRIHALTARAGLQRKVTPHDLRATFATQMLEAGVDLRVIQVMLGHASPETTARYIRVRPDLLRQVPSLLTPAKR